MTRSYSLGIAAVVMLAFALSCSIKKYAVNKIGDTLAEGNSVYETDEDIVLVGEALPFGLKLVETLLIESPKHRGLLLTACRGFVLYSYAYVHYDAEVEVDRDLDRARSLRERARKLYLRAYGYGLRALERSYPGIGERLVQDPETAVGFVKQKRRKRDLPLVYWTAASLGLAISVSKNDASMLARLPEVEALLNRALELDEAWDEGALHEFMVTFASAKPGAPDREAIRRHYERALELSEGKSASLHLAYAEAVSVRTQNREQFRSLVEKALAVDPQEHPNSRLVNLLAHRRARWLMSRIDELFLEEEDSLEPAGVDQ